MSDEKVEVVPAKPLERWIKGAFGSAGVCVLAAVGWANDLSDQMTTLKVTNDTRAVEAEKSEKRLTDVLQRLDERGTRLTRLESFAEQSHERDIANQKRQERLELKIDDLTRAVLERPK